MRAANRLIAAAALLMFAGGLFAQGRGGRGGGGAPPAPGACDRPCLEGFVNQYLDALVAHNAFGLPLNRRISEIESLVLRGAGSAINMEKAGTPDPVLTETVPVAERLPRSKLIATANTYFEAIEQGNGGVAPFHKDCNRFENGTLTSGPQGCSAQLDTHIFDYIQKIYPRRFVVVDEERQLAFGFFMFNHPGDITWIKNADGTRHEMGSAATRPFSVDVAELFRIKDGQIRKVEALMVSLPYGQKNPYVPQQ